MNEEIKLNSKQRKFVDEYLKSFNATTAAKNAGYSEKTAYSIGQRLLKHDNIQNIIDAELEEIHKRQKKIFTRAADAAIKALVDTVENGRGLARVNAANSILDRSGHKPVDRVQSDVNANVHADVNIEDARQELIEKFNRRYPLSEGEECAVDDAEPENSEIITK